MQIEFEVKILDIDIKDIQKKLKFLGAKKCWDRLFKRYTYDVHPPDPFRWVRLRDEGAKIVLTFKHIVDDKRIDGTKETEIEVSDFEKTNEILHLLGYDPKQYQETRRIHYELDEVCIEIDFWPKIPAYLEIEGNSKKTVEQMVKKLGFDLSQTTPMHTIDVYRKYGIELYSFKKLTFD